MMHHGLASKRENWLGHIEGEGAEAGACSQLQTRVSNCLDKAATVSLARSEFGSECLQVRLLRFCTMLTTSEVWSPFQSLSRSCGKIQIRSAIGCII
jgi:hypothetical protein